MKKNSILWLWSALAAVMLLACNGNNNSGTETGEAGGGSQAKQPVSVPQGTEDFSAFFTQTFSGKTADEASAIIDALVHPEMGLFLVFKPGAVPVVRPCKNSTELKANMAPVVDYFANIQFPVQKGELPFYDCDTFDKEGTYFKEGGNGEFLATTYKNVEEAMYTTFSDAEKANAKKCDGMVSHVVVATQAGLQLGFGRVDNKWYLLTIDIAQFDCGA